MPDPILQRFRDVGETKMHVSGLTQDAPLPTGNLGGRLFRTLDEKNSNIAITTQFYESLKREYGEHVAKWAFEGYESRFESGQPLSGHRIQQIVNRAKEAQGIDRKTLDDQLTGLAPDLLDRALTDNGLAVAKDSPCYKDLLNLTRDAIRKDERFKDPGKLEQRFFTESFLPVIDRFVKDHPGIGQVGQYEQMRQQLLGQIENGEMPFGREDWGVLPKDVLRDLVTPNNDRRAFLANFEGGTVEDHFRPLSDSRFMTKFGTNTPDTLLSYDEALKTRKCNNGTYVLVPGPNFTEFHRMEHGPDHPKYRDEKYHISVDPKDIDKAYKALAPLLLEEGSPIQFWKVVNVDGAKERYEQKSRELEQLNRGEGRFSNVPPEHKARQRDDLRESFKESLRLYNGDQFTFYITPDQRGEDFTAFLRMLEQTLTETGVRPVPPPESDETIGKFVTVRIGSTTYKPEDDGYEQARLEHNKKNPHVESGQEVKVWADPFAPDYDQHRARFGSNPFYTAQIGFLLDNYGGEIARTQDELGMVKLGQHGDFMMSTGRSVALGATLGRMSLPQEHKGLVDSHVALQTEHIQKHLGIDGEVPQELEPFVDLVPEICRLGVAFSQPGPVTLALRDQLQRCIGAFDEARRGVMAMGNDAPQQTRDYLAFFERELKDMSVLAREGQDPILALISDITAGYLTDPRVGDGGHDAINELEKLPFLKGDPDSKAKAALILEQAGKIMLKATDPDLPADVRLRMVGELDSLEEEFRRTIHGWSDRLEESDTVGRQALGDLRNFPFDLDLGDYNRFFRQINGSEIPDARENINQAFGKLGRDLEMIERGLLPLDEEKPELRDQIAYLDTFFRDYIPAPGQRGQFERLKGEVDRLRAYVS